MVSLSVWIWHKKSCIHHHIFTFANTYTQTQTHTHTHTKTNRQLFTNGTDILINVCMWHSVCMSVCGKTKLKSKDGEREWKREKESAKKRNFLLSKSLVWNKLYTQKHSSVVNVEQLAKQNNMLSFIFMPQRNPFVMWLQQNTSKSQTKKKKKKILIHTHTFMAIAITFTARNMSIITHTHTGTHIYARICMHT